MKETDFLLDDLKDKATSEEKDRVHRVLEEVSKEREKTSGEFRGRLSQAQWREIELLWESGDITLKELSEKYGKSTDTIYAHFKSKGIKRGARAEELRKIADSLAKQKAQEESHIISERIRNTKEQHYKMAEAIGKLVFKEVLQVQSSGSKYREIQQDLKSLHVAMETLKKVREERWVVLGLDKDVVDEDSLPELIMSTMTAEQAQALRDAQEEDDDFLGIDDEQLEMTQV